MSVTLADGARVPRVDRRHDVHGPLSKAVATFFKHTIWFEPTTRSIYSFCQSVSSRTG
jgi:hypothetical protein